MRRIFVVVALGAVSAACSGGDPEQMKRELAHSMSNKQASSAQAYYERSVELARMNGCWNCHHVDNDLIGPSWRRVSAHYKGDPNARAWLIEKVKHGGSGVWSSTTSGAVMPPNSPRVSDQDIGELVDFILSLAREKTPDKAG